MTTERPTRQRTLARLAGLCAVLFVLDVVILLAVGELPSAWWFVAVPVGLLVVPVVGAVALAMLFAKRRRAR